MKIQFFAYLRDSEYANCKGLSLEGPSTLKELGQELSRRFGAKFHDHFFNEDERALKEQDAIKNNDIDSLLKLMVESGRSSFEYLQNVYPASRVNSQSLSIGLAVADTYLGSRGAYRVHGGGFEGTIQAVVPKDMTEGFRKAMKDVFGEDCLLEVKVRPFGTKMIV